MRLKLKRHYKLIVMLVLLSAALTVGLGDRPIVAYTIDDSLFHSDSGGALALAEEAAVSGGLVTLLSATSIPEYRPPQTE